MKYKVLSHDPLKVLSLLLVVTCAVVVTLVWTTYYSTEQARAATNRSIEIEKLRGSIIHLDEVLTMSANMAAATGDSEWETRYRRSEQQLEAFIEQALDLFSDPTLISAINMTGTANTELVVMENKVFALVRDNRLKEARAILSSEDYVRFKISYRHGFDLISDCLADMVKATRVKEKRGEILHYSVIAFMFVPLLTATWLVMLRRLRDWKSKHDQKIVELKDEIVQRENIEKKLVRSETKFRTLFESTEEAVMLLDENGFFDCNSATLRIFRCRDKEQFCCMHPADLSTYEQPCGSISLVKANQHIAAAMANGSESFEWVHIRVDSGEEFPAEIHLSAMELDGRTVVQATVRDITERKLAEEALRNSEIRYRTLLEGSPVCNKIISLDSRLQYMSDAGIKQLKIQDISSLYGCIYPPAHYPEAARNLLTEHLEKAKAGETSSVECSVMDIGGSDVWYHTTFVPVCDNDGRVINIIGASVDITKRKLAELALRRKEDLLSKAQEIAHIGSFEWDVTRDIVTWSDEMFNIHGISRDDFGGSIEDVMPLVHPDDRKIIQERIEKTLQEHTLENGKNEGLEYRIVRPDGEIRTVFARSELEHASDETSTIFTGFVQDITERKQAEEEMRNNAARFERWKSSNFIGILQGDDDGNISDANDALLGMLGYSREDLLEGKLDWKKLTPPEFSHLDQNAIEECATLGYCRPFQKEYFHRDGYRVPILIGASIFKEDPGEYIAFAVDLTESRKAEEALRKSESLMAKAQDIAHIGSYEWDIEQDQFSWSDEMFNIFGINQNDFVGTLAEVLSYIYPDDCEMIRNRHEYTLENGNNEGLEYRIVRPDGEVRTVFAQSEVQEGESDTDRKLVGFIQDVTQRKHDEMHLQRSEVKYRTLVESSPYCIHQIDADGKLLTMNHAGLQMLGKQVESEVAGIPYLDMVCKEDRGRIAVLMDVAFTGASSEFEFGIEGGSVFSSNFVPIFDANGKVDRLLGITHDITDRKNAERNISHERDRAQNYLDIAGEIIVTIDSEQIVTLINREGCQLLGYKETEIVGKNWFDNFLPVHTRETARQSFVTLMQGEMRRLERYETEITTASGEPRIISWYYSLLERDSGEIHGTLGAGIDITKQKQAEEELRRSHEEMEQRVIERTLEVSEKTAQLQAIYNAIPDLVFILNHKGEVVSFQNGSEKLLYKSPGEFYGKTMHDILPPDVGRQFESALEEVQNNKSSATFEYPLEINNQEKWFQARLLPFTGEDNVAIIEDVSDRKQMEKQLRLQQKKLNDVSQVSRLGEMATGLAHELNQPLGAILLYANSGQELLANADTATQMQFGAIFEKLVNLSSHAGGIVRQLRRLIEKKAPVFSKVDIAEPILSLLNLMDSDLRKNNVSVKQQMGHANRSTIVDEIQIQQVLMNLIRNAVDSMQETDRDQRTLNIATLIRNDKLIEVAICDNGCGVHNKSKEQIFDHFFTTKTEGLGVGLSISRDIIERHKGQLWMTPNSGRGLTFHFTLPTIEIGLEDNSCDELTVEAT